MCILAIYRHCIEIHMRDNMNSGAPLNFRLALATTNMLAVVCLLNLQEVLIDHILLPAGF